MSEDELIGTELDEYRLEVLLGEGGMARVYRGRDLYLQRFAAIKVISPTYRADPDYLERFEREARAIASLEHPHIVRLYRYGEAQGLLYMAMQLVEGSDLGTLLKGYRQDGEYIESAEATRLIREIGTALDYVHDRGIIHRDVKSSNVMLDQAGQACLTDFGLVLLTQIGTRGEIFGSPHYLAPEQAISSAKAVPQSDLYALGVIAWEMFTGQLPFDAKEPLELAMQHMTQEPPRPRDLRPELPAQLEAVLLKALAKKPEERYQTGAELAAAIENAWVTPLTTAPLETPPTSKTIPERVALHMAVRPLPPILAAMTPSLPPADNPNMPSAPAGYSGSDTLPAYAVAAESPAAARPASPPSAALSSQQAQPPYVSAISSRGRKTIPLLITAVSAICIVGACLALVNLGRAGWQGLQAGLPVAGKKTTPSPATRAAAVTSTSSSAGPTANPSTVSSPTAPVAQPTPTPSPVPAPVTVNVVITRCQDGHCLGLINQSQIDLPLSGLVILGKDFTYAGTDWGVTALSPGGCLVLTGNAKRWTPDDPACQNPAATLVSEADFWKKEFGLTFAGQSLGECGKAQRYCEFTLPVEGSSPPALTFPPGTIFGGDFGLNPPLMP